MRLKLPYGRTSLECTLPKHRVNGVLRGRLDSYVPSGEPEQLVIDSMNHPCASLPLWQLAQGKQKVVLIASDHTRPVPSKVIVPEMLRQIRAGSPDADITILIATGCHRGTRLEELEEKFGSEIVAREKILVHDCEDEDNLITIGTLPSGGELRINRLAAEADLLVAEGFIEPHFFAGFSGGRKSVLPGIASRTCVHYNHNSGFMDDPHARAGVLENNPIHRDMLYAAKAINLAYIVNVVINSQKQVIASFAGDCEQAHLEGTRFVMEQMGCFAIPADVVITTNNGYPLDQNVYQMVKGMSTAEAACRDGGVIIAVGQCGDGIGGESFLRMFRECGSASELLRKFRDTPPEETVTDQWQAHILARILEHHTVILVSDVDPELVRMLNMYPASDMEESLKIAAQILGREDYDITVIPEGISVIVTP